MESCGDGGCRDSVEEEREVAALIGEKDAGVWGADAERRASLLLLATASFISVCRWANLSATPLRFDGNETDPLHSCAEKSSPSSPIVPTYLGINVKVFSFVCMSAPTH